MESILDSQKAKSYFIIAREFMSLKEYDKSVEYYEKSAQMGNIEAMIKLYYWYLGEDELIGIKPNYKRRIYWSKKLAPLGKTECQSELGIYYYDKGDLKNAVYWLEKAYSKGDFGAGLYLEVKIKGKPFNEYFKKMSEKQQKSTEDKKK